MNEEKDLQQKELEQVTGGEEKNANGGYFRCTNPDCPVHYRRLSFAPENCLDCGWPMEYVHF